MRWFDIRQSACNNSFLLHGCTDDTLSLVQKPVGFYPDDGFKITHHGKVWNDEEQLLDFNLTDGAVLVCWPNWRNRHRSRSNAAQCSSIHHDQEASPGVFILDAEEKQSPECLHATSDHAAASSVVANPETREWPSAPARVQNHRDATQLPVGDAAGVQEKSYCAATASSQRGASSDVGHRFLCESPDQSPYADSVHLALNSTPPRLSAEGGTLKADCAFNQQSRVERSGEGACEARNSHAVATADCKAEENRTTTNLDTLDRLVWTERVQSEVGSDLKREDGYSTAFESFEQESPTGHLQSAFEDARHKHLPLPPGNLDRRASDENDEEEEEDDMMLASPPIQYSREMSLDAASSKNSRGRQISHDSIVHMDRPLRK